MDIVDILRSCRVSTVYGVDVFVFEGGCVDDVAEDAANEIVRLRARVAEIETALTGIPAPPAPDQV